MKKVIVVLAFFAAIYGLGIQLALAQAPTISYSTPNSYPINTAITPLVPTSSGVSAQGYELSPQEFTSARYVGAGYFSSVAVDAAGNVYWADSQNNEIYERDPMTNVYIPGKFNNPRAIAVDAYGYVYVADTGNNAVKKIRASDGTTIILGSGFNQPRGVAVDAVGNVYVADAGNNAVKEILAENGTVITLGSGFLNPTGVAVDGSGNIYVADKGNNAVKKIPAGNGTVITLGSGFQELQGVAVDAAGNVFSVDQDPTTNNSSVNVISAGSKLMYPASSTVPFPMTGSVITLWSGSRTMTGIAVDASGKIYLTENNGIYHYVEYIAPSGGYHTSFLPAGLTIDSETGIISGTPKMITAAKNYTVTACSAIADSGISVTNTVSIGVFFGSLNRYGQNTPGAEKVNRYGQIGGTPINRNGEQITSVISVGQAVGSAYQGGIVAYLFVPGDLGYVTGETHGLIAAPVDQSTGVNWDDGSNTSCATGTALGTGLANTSAIIVTMLNRGATSTAYAAGVARLYNGGGYTDWYLPSKDELFLIWQNIGQGAASPRTNIGGFTDDYYWSSSEYISGNAAWSIPFQYGLPDGFGKSGPYALSVRAVRTF